MKHNLKYKEFAHSIHESNFYDCDYDVMYVLASCYQLVRQIDKRGDTVILCYSGVTTKMYWTPS